MNSTENSTTYNPQCMACREGATHQHDAAGKPMHTEPEYSVEYGDETGASVTHTGTHAEMAALFVEILAMLAPEQAAFSVTDPETGMPVGSDDVADAPHAEQMPYIGHASELEEERAISRHGYDVERGNWTLMFGATLTRTGSTMCWDQDVEVESDGGTRFKVTTRASDHAHRRTEEMGAEAASFTLAMIAGGTVAEARATILEHAERVRIARRELEGE